MGMGMYLKTCAIEKILLNNNVFNWRLFVIWKRKTSLKRLHQDECFPGSTCSEGQNISRAALKSLFQFADFE